MNRETLFTDEPVEFEKQPVQFQDFRENKRSMESNLQNIPPSNKEKPKDVNM